jgi:hypothetical protein
MSGYGDGLYGDALYGGGGVVPPVVVIPEGGISYTLTPSLTQIVLTVGTTEAVIIDALTAADVAISG